MGLITELEIWQKEALRTYGLEKSTAEIFREEGIDIDDVYIEMGKRRTPTYKSTYNFSELPDAWPIGLGRMIYEQYPEEIIRDLDGVKVGMILDKDINAIAWRASKEIGIFDGIANFFLIGSYATSPYKCMFRENISELPKPVLTLANDIETLSKEAMLTTNNNEFFMKIAESYRHRSILARDFPDVRPMIESICAITANNMIRFIILHELSHIIFKHKPRNGTASQDQEHQADEKAVELSMKMSWPAPLFAIYGSLSISFLEFNSRQNGSNVQESTKYIANRTHPPYYHRRARILSKIIELYDYLIPNERKDDFRDSFLICHHVHIVLSKFLEQEKLKALSPFHIPMSVKTFRIPGLPTSAIGEISRTLSWLENGPFDGLSIK